MTPMAGVRLLVLCWIASIATGGFAAEKAAPIRALLITGGCCHDYDNQKTIIPEGVSGHSSAEIDWTVIHQGGTKGDVEIPFYKDPEWADGFDVVVHNECFANIPNVDFVQGILEPHKAGTPAVLVHCSMHCYRTGPAKADWWEFCGVHSPGHGPKHPFEVELIDTEHEITSGLSNWTTPKGELYFIEKVFPGTVALAQSKSKKTGEMNINVWAHEYGEKQTRVFATTIGHHNETMRDPKYLQMLTRGILWAAGRPVDETFTP